MNTLPSLPESSKSLDMSFSQYELGMLAIQGFSDKNNDSDIGQKTVDFQLEPNILNTGNQKGVSEAKNPQLKIFRKYQSFT